MPTELELQSAPEATLYADSAVNMADDSLRVTATSSVSILLAVLGIAIVVLYLVLWIYILVDAIRRHDLKESKLLWIVLLLFVGPIGMIVYGFVEGKRKLGWWSVVATLGIPVILVLYAVAVFV